VTGKAVILEYDFTVLNGAALLFDTTRRFLLELDGIAFDVPREHRFLEGENYQVGLGRMFVEVKTKKTAAKAAKDLAAAFQEELGRAIPKSVTVAFRNFVRALVAKGVKVVIATRADICSDAVRLAFDDLLGDGVVLYQEPSVCYGSVKWDSWSRACTKNNVRRAATLAITGSGRGVKSALLVGMASLAVVNDHVAFQDFGGANDVVSALDSAAAKKVLSILRIDRKS